MTLKPFLLSPERWTGQGPNSGSKHSLSQTLTETGKSDTPGCTPAPRLARRANGCSATHPLRLQGRAAPRASYCVTRNAFATSFLAATAEESKPAGCEKHIAANHDQKTHSGAVSQVEHPCEDETYKQHRCGHTRKRFEDVPPIRVHRDLRCYASFRAPDCGPSLRDAPLLARKRSAGWARKTARRWRKHFRRYPPSPKASRCAP